MFVRTRPPRPLTWLLLLGAVALAWGSVVACGGIADDPQPGASCGQLGTTKSLGDDCANTCTCTEEGWSCTAVACFPPGAPPDVACSEGDRLDNGCNSCTCSASGGWQCTLIGCPDSPECGWRESPRDACNTCSCTDEGWVCTQRACDPPAEPPLCEEGAVTNENCMRCVCEDGAWNCMALICGIATECRPGAESPADDGCNTCTCDDSGFWACTEIGCDYPVCGGFAGLTCDEPDAYCHYEPEAQCGAGDVQGACRTRPTACTKEAVPVCGCDGNDYSNACEANAAGTSVAAEGQCITQ